MSYRDFLVRLRRVRASATERRRIAVRKPAPGRELYVATGAVLLEVLHADAEPTLGQRLHLETALGEQLGLARRARRALVRDAERARETLGLQPCIQLVAESYSRLQKLQLVRIMEDAIHLDGIVTHAERYVVRKLGRLLRVDRSVVEALDRSGSHSEPLELPAEPSTPAS